MKPSSKSEEIDYERCSYEACGYFRYDHNGENPRNLKTGGWIYGHKFKPQPPVSAPEKCPKCGQFLEQIPPNGEWFCPCPEFHKPDSAQPTPSEGPYRVEVRQPSVGSGFYDHYIGPGLNTGILNVITLNEAYAQGQAQSAKKIESLKKFHNENYLFIQQEIEKIKAERDQLKARWEKLKVYGASISMGIDSRLRDKMKELEQ